MASKNRYMEQYLYNTKFFNTKSNRSIRSSPPPLIMVHKSTLERKRQHYRFPRQLQRAKKRQKTESKCRKRETIMWFGAKIPTLKFSTRFPYWKHWNYRFCSAAFEISIFHLNIQRFLPIYDANFSNLIAYIFILWNVWASTLFFNWRIVSRNQQFE